MKNTDKFKELLGIQLIDVKDGYAKATLKVSKEHINGLNVTNGGVIFSFADYTFAEACNFGENSAVAIQASINFLKPTFEGDTLTAEAICVSNSRTLGLYNVTVCKEDEKIAVFSGLAYKKHPK